MADLTKITLANKGSSLAPSIPIDFIQAPMTTLLNQVIDKTIDSLHRIFAEKNVDYDSPEERQDNLKTYYSENYPNLHPAKMKKNVFNAIQGGLWTKEGLMKKENNVEDNKAKLILDNLATLTKNKKKKSIKDKKKGSIAKEILPNQKAIETKNEEKDKIAKKFNYEDLLKSDYVPARAYIEVSQALLAENNPLKSPQKSYEILKLGAQRIGSSYRFYPYLIPAAKANGETQLAEQYTIECSENKDTGLMQILVDTLGKNKAVNPIYSECVKALGYDPLSQKTTGQNNWSPFNGLLPQPGKIW